MKNTQKKISKSILSALIGAIYALACITASIVSASFIGNAVATSFGDPSMMQPITFGILVMAAFAILFVKMEAGILTSALDITALNTALGAYFRKGKDTIIRKMLLGMDIEGSFDIWDDCKDEVAMPNLGITDIVKPANDLTFQPTANALAFGARILKVRKWKVDLLIVPGVLEKSWLGKYKTKGSNAFDIPFEQFIMDYIIAKVHDNIRLQSLYRGVYNSAGTTPLDIMDGINTLIAAELVAGTITPVATGAITSSNVVDKLLLVYDGLGEAYKNDITEMPVNSTIFDWLTRKFSPVLNTSLISADTVAAQNGLRINAFPLPGTNCVVKREPGLGSSQRVHVTSPINKVYGVDSLGEENNIKIQEFERTLKLMIDGKGGVNFKECHNDALRVNDQV